MTLLDAMESANGNCLPSTELKVGGRVVGTLSEKGSSMVGASYQWGNGDSATFPRTDRSFWEAPYPPSGWYIPESLASEIGVTGYRHIERGQVFVNIVFDENDAPIFKKWLRFD